MKENDPRQVVDLSRYREAAARREAEARAARTKRAPQGRSEGVFGSRKGAPLILILIALFMFALWLAPKLTNFG